MLRDITYWDPFRDMHQLRAEIEGLIDRAASGAKSAVGAPWRPVSDVVETDDAIMITAELPGCKDEDVEVLVRDRVLTIRGTRTMEESSEDEHYRRVERSYGDFERSFRLPQGRLREGRPREGRLRRIAGQDREAAGKRDDPNPGHRRRLARRPAQRPTPPSALGDGCGLMPWRRVRRPKPPDSGASTGAPPAPPVVRVGQTPPV